MNCCTEKIAEYSPHLNVGDKTLKLAFYAAQGVCLTLSCVACVRAKRIRQITQVRQVLWGLFTARDLAKMPLVLDKEKRTYSLCFLMAFRLLFTIRSLLKISCWSGYCLNPLMEKLARPLPYCVLAFSGISLWRTHHKEETDYKDHLSTLDDVSELICTSLEAGFIPPFEGNQMFIVAAGLSSATASLCKNTITVCEGRE